MAICPRLKAKTDDTHTLNMKKTFLALTALATTCACLLLAQDAAVKLPKQPSAPGASVYIISPSHGETVPSTFTVKFGLKGMGIAPAGIAYPNSGHHHMLIDTVDMPNMNMPLPATDLIKHFGKGQTETEITLAPGQHTLQLVLGDLMHIPHEPPVISQKITITVAE